MHKEQADAIYISRGDNPLKTRREAGGMNGVQKIFPVHLRGRVEKAIREHGALEEIRIRIGQPVIFSGGDRELYLSGENSDEVLTEETKGAYRMGEEDLSETVTFLSRYSRYAFEEEMKNGFVTLEGGHRVGVAGQVRMERGEVADISYIRFLNIRIARERVGCARGLIPYLRDGDAICNTLFFSAPGVGKTTYLRDCIRLLSDEEGLSVSLIDERSEIAACHLGIPQNNVGMRTDVLDGVSKQKGMQMMIRSMAPKVLAVDELGGEADYRALTQALYCGCRILGTVHAGTISELWGKEEFILWKKSGIFKRYVLLKKGGAGARFFEVYNARRERVC